ncbi:MAG: EAL domain-containing protein [Gammaproteobacteria bacterium]|nr:EAL domain-containing protein [Gammaproteobacteria bacterium]
MTVNRKTNRHSYASTKAPWAPEHSARSSLTSQPATTSTSSTKQFFANAPFGCFILDPDGAIVEANELGSQVLGDLPADAATKRLSMLAVANDQGEVEQHLKAVFNRQEHRHSDIRLVARDGSEIPVTLRTSPVVLAGRTVQAHCAIINISEHKNAEASLRKAKNYLEHLAHHDPLTGFPNRLLFNDRLNVALRHAQRRSKKLAVLFMDIDRFKFINDSVGHQIGDELLCEVARRIRAAVREEDTVSRLGGDEFTVILENLENPADLATISRKISMAVAQPIHLRGHELFVTVSIGVCSYPANATTAEDMMKFADDAMYRAKDSGRNAIQFVTPALLAETSNRVEIERDLRHAVPANQLRVLYQPIFHATTERIVGFEALLRWEHPERGTLPPAAFIAIAEESGQIGAISDWVLRKACMQTRLWMEATGADVRVGVNISPRQFSQAGLDATVRQTLGEAGLPAHCLELEVTESLLLANPEVGVSMLGKLRNMGVHIAIDDFGTGYSSLSRLRGLPITRLKIDASFVKGIPTNADDRSIAAAIISMGHSLGLEVVSEGVENELQRAYLVDQSCDLLQGFHLSHPLEVDAATALLCESSHGVDNRR